MKKYDLEKQYEFTAYVNHYRTGIEHFTGVKVLLEDIYFENNELFRDHTWVNSSHRFKNIKKGTMISFKAKIHKYQSSSGEKCGLKSLRLISSIENQSCA